MPCTPSSTSSRIALAEARSARRLTQNLASPSTPSRTSQPYAAAAFPTPPRTIRTYSKHSGRRSYRRSPSPSPPPVALTTSQECNSVFRAQRIQDSIDEALKQFKVTKDLSALDTSLAYIKADARQLEDQLSQVSALLVSVSKRPICLALTRRPFVLSECGHSFCGPCLRKLFSGTLEKKLRPLGLLEFASTQEFNAYVAPTCPEHLKITLEGLALYQHNPHSYFRYACPMCRASIKIPPVDPISLKELFAGLREALGGRLGLGEETMVDESRMSGTGYFVGLFLP